MDNLIPNGLREPLDPRYRHISLEWAPLARSGRTVIQRQDGPDSWREDVDLSQIPAGTGGSYGTGYVEGIEVEGPVELVPVGAGLAAAIVPGVPGDWVGYAEPGTYLAEVRWRAGHARTGSHDGFCRFVAR